MDSHSGNSGSQIVKTVLKYGPECAQEGAYCKVLGVVCPEVYEIVPAGYVMEQLHHAPRSLDLLIKIELALQIHVWGRNPIPTTTDREWHQELELFGIRVPKGMTGEPSLCHGDPTVSNTFIRGNDTIVIADPRPPRAYVPQFMETDMGGILQSYFGWETAAYGSPHVDYEPPLFYYDPEKRAKAMFWLGAKAARIEYGEREKPYFKGGKSLNRPNILEWCYMIRRMTNV